MRTPEELRYSTDHEWVRLENGNRARLGITDYAQDALGDVVYLSLPEVGREVAAGEPIGEIESTKSVSDVYAPLAGEVVEINTGLDDAPETLNSDPYGEGWICVLQLSSAAEFEELMDASAYVDLTQS